MSLTKSRALGCIWGNCTGDALGGPVQFKPKGQFKPVTGLRTVEPFGQPAGSYSDDGSMTLALSQSFIDQRGKYNHVGSIKYFVSWLFSGQFSTAKSAWDVGRSTRIALTIWNKNGSEDIEHTQSRINQKLDMEECSGNGSLMRISPIGLALWKDIDEARRRARERSQITHPSLACLDACELYTELLCRIMAGETKEQLVQTASAFKISHATLAERLSKYKNLSDWKLPSEADMQSSGWVVDTLEVALWGLFKYDSWADGALAVVNLGGDSDTAGAVYGALAGAFYGFASIPSQWVEGMKNFKLIQEIAEGISGLV
ncbi:ADP-ribosylglycohydrolase [Aspergillus sclerotialis]|uniref:ADP-ribosylhydrolase ARH3 n=1 Tax=Aspergillus sclerotialis TaxID=2070753 RepID=A0A3A2ZJI6_9EURO|nr:ADP-ribosylglycohydrolase [Aspergillus sclerotialis]